jgi:hypothetical protein
LQHHHHQARQQLPKDKINYDDLPIKNAWLDKYSGDMKDLLGLELSGTFEKVEKAVNQHYSTEDPKGIFSVHEDENDKGRPSSPDLIGNERDSLDVTGLETLKRMTPHRDDPQKAIHNNKGQHGKNAKAKPQIFDCDVSEIANR